MKKARPVLIKTNRKEKENERFEFERYQLDGGGKGNIAAPKIVPGKRLQKIQYGEV